MGDYQVFDGETYSRLTCGECGIVFYPPSGWLTERKNNGGSFTCPNGHPRVFKESELDRVRRERDKLRQREAMLLDEKATEQRRADLAEKRERRLKKRASAGVCPCCHKTVKQMAAHMQTKHPDFVKEQGGNVVKLKVPA